ncbi:phosphoglycerate dehydrogenase [Aliarcobacter trophiarum LMG 25534]|uniref:D-3-phosphoglycerate dehydrogenase n=1 Tax=Aliarcobacter trophiarum LMG 25534 TaxID=1032241 RepID=A0AAD0QKF6_9BACT|nr:phosphoglycerate dehydrogenase [Aliarcobacter trophiarum]AXK49573.1 alpha-ketoglutarate reductase / D-3-phosphoglycerate dehydrogenase [Aliarcobacter trophiarum LMG 25534]RXI27502.1 phosphoglycerate dehydrogenase [Aliarcobacter trophiarum]RXJ92249.1 phosphoglycerate dehydrogenase [Aliarcobacter trophiarum LMG 25534]
MSKKTIVVCDHIHEAGLKILEKTEDINYIFAANVDKVKLLDIIKDADVAITRSSTDVDEKFLNAAVNLKAIIRAGVGYDNVDIEGCSKRGIIAMNVPTANTIAAVELTMAHMLSCMRKFPYAHNQLKIDRVWKREDWYGNELYGKKLGVIGFGNIGHRVALRAKAFEMDVITYDPFIPSTKATDLGITYTTNFDDILACDIITIHTPKNKETIDMISFDEIKKMKDGVILINCARGGLYNEEALVENLKSGKIAMAGIDVFKKEPATSHPLLDLPNVTVTAHLGANTKESQKEISVQSANNAIESARGVAYPNALNLPIDESKIPNFVKPYIELTQKMAFLLAQISKSEIRAIDVSAEGELAEFVDSLQTFASVGVLSASASSSSVNYVNANFIAKEKNIELTTKKLTNNSGYKNKVTIKITTSKGVKTISGTVFEDSVQRVVDIDGYKIDVEPKGKMILMKNKDIPGVIGQVGTLLAKNSINISDFRLSRGKENTALAVILIDEKANSKVISELDGLEASISVAYAEI